MDWLNPSSARADQFMVRAAEPFRLGLNHRISSAELTRPDGSRKTLPVEPEARELIVSDTARQGIYRLRADTNDVTFCVNLLDSLESNIAAREDLPFGKYDKVSATTLKRANLELWRWIAAFGLLVLMFEWWFYHKRSV